MVVQSNCGNGKTIALIIAMLNRAEERQAHPQILCFSPTFEVAMQTCNVMKSLAVFSNVKVALALPKQQSTFDIAILLYKRVLQNVHMLYFSVVLGAQLTSHVIIGTPKEIATYRILGLFDVKKIQMAVFDDGDIVATSHLVIDHVVRHLPPNCQKILFSATLNNASLKHFEDASVLRLLRENELQENVHQTYCVCTNLAEKLNVINAIFIKAMAKRFDDAGQFIVFCSVSESLEITK